MSSKDKLLKELSSFFNCDIDYEKLDFIYKCYAELGKNSRFNVINYPFIKNLLDKQAKRNSDFEDLVRDCLSDGYSNRYGVLYVEDKVYVVELGLREFNDLASIEDYYSR